MWTRRWNWLRGLERRMAERVTDERDWLIDLQVQMGVQDMAATAARIAAEERASFGH